MSSNSDQTVHMRADRYRSARAQLVDLSEGTHSVSRPGRRVIIALAAASAVVGVSAFAFVAQSEPVSDRSYAVCRTGADTGAFELQIANGSSSQTDQQVMVANAQASCADLWSMGVLRLGASREFVAQGENLRRDYPVPSLTSCVDDAGIAVVIPSDNLRACQGLGLAPAQG